jgi:hypothetical protein
MTVERDNYGEFHVRGTYDDGKPGWGIKVWLKGSSTGSSAADLTATWANRRKRPSWRLLNSGRKNFP